MLKEAEEGRATLEQRPVQSRSLELLKAIRCIEPEDGKIPTVIVGRTGVRNQLHAPLRADALLHRLQSLDRVNGRGGGEGETKRKLKGQGTLIDRPDARRVAIGDLLLLSLEVILIEGEQRAGGEGKGHQGRDNSVGNERDKGRKAGEKGRPKLR